MSGTAAPPTAGPSQAQVAQVRAFNRFYTNVIGVLHDMYLDTPSLARSFTFMSWKSITARADSGAAEADLVVFGVLTKAFFVHL